MLWPAEPIIYTSCNDKNTNLFERTIWLFSIVLVSMFSIVIEHNTFVTDFTYFLLKTKMVLFGKKSDWFFYLSQTRIYMFSYESIAVPKYYPKHGEKLRCDSWAA